MDQCQIGFELWILQVSVVIPQLVGSEETLVDHCAIGQGADVEPSPRLDQLMAGPLPKDENLPFEGLLIASGWTTHKHLTGQGLRLAGHHANGRLIGRHSAPGNHLQSKTLGQIIELLLGSCMLSLIQVENARGIVTQLRQGYTLLGTANGEYVGLVEFEGYAELNLS